MSELADVFLTKFKEQANNNKQQLIEQVAVWIAEIFLSETKIEIDHDLDPPWDSSGRTVDTNEPFDLNDYTSLDCFIENEYTGASEPSFMSGMGFFHRVYAKDLDEFITEWIFMQGENIIHLLLEEKNEVLLEQLTLHQIEHNNQFEVEEFIYEVEAIDDFLVWDFPVQLRKEIGEMDILFLFKMGQAQAQQNLRNEEIERQKRNEELRINQEKAKKYWDKICKLHKFKYQKDMPHKVEKPYYDQYVYPILEMECKENSDAVHNIRLLGTFLSLNFSNSVAHKLSYFKSNGVHKK